MKVQFISKTASPDFDTPEQLMAYCARVSSSNQDNEEYVNLLAYCIKQQHWSVFEMADMTVEITTTRAISPQILRHRSFNYSEKSQRYSKALGIEVYEARRQDTKDRQNSIEDMSDTDKAWFIEAQKEVQNGCFARYEEALERGIAKECARTLLPLGTVTRLYMKGSVRSWIHYLQIRTDAHTQKEHRDIALGVKEIFCEHFPFTAAALKWI